MANRTRPITLRVPVNEQEHALIAEKMNLIPTTNLAHHLMQSFEPGEVDYQTAHGIGRRLADEVTKGQYEYVLTTHIDRATSTITFCFALSTL